MNRQSQWLFEAPFVLENDHYNNLHTKPEYYSKPEGRVKGNPSQGKSQPKAPSALWKGGVFIPCDLSDEGVSQNQLSSDEVYEVPYHVEFMGFYREVGRVLSTKLPVNYTYQGKSTPFPSEIVWPRLEFWKGRLRSWHQSLGPKIKNGTRVFLVVTIFYYLKGRGRNQRVIFCDFMIPES